MTDSSPPPSEYTIVYWDFMIPTGANSVQHDVLCPDGMRAIDGGNFAPLGWHHEASEAMVSGHQSTEGWRHALVGPDVNSPTHLRLFANCVSDSVTTRHVVETVGWESPVRAGSREAIG